MLRKFLIAYILAFSSGWAAALTFELDNDALLQGALVTGRTDAKQLKVFDREVYLDAQGAFVFGLGRDTPSTIVLRLTDVDGLAHKKVFKVRQRVYNVDRVNGVEQKYVSPPKDVLARIQQEAVLVRRARAESSLEKDFRQGFTRPAQGRVSGVYGSQRVFNGVPKRPHYGLDIAGPVGTPVVAPAAGRVSLAHNNMYYSGGTLIIDHGQGVSSTFIHLSKIHVSVGQRVESGQRIADIGATGRVTGPHLDWRVNWFEQRLDPELLLPKASSD